MADRPLLENLLKRGIDANVKYWEAVGRAASDYVQTVSKIWADAPIAFTPGTFTTRSTTTTRPSGPALLLEGPAGTQARAVVMISNDLDRDADAAVSVTDLRAPDGQRVSFDIRPSPDRVKLARGEKVPVTLTADITDAMADGVDYEGEINVPGLSTKGVPVVLRRRG